MDTDADTSSSNAGSEDAGQSEGEDPLDPEDPDPDLPAFPECGNGRLEDGEECDGAEFGGRSCEDEGGWGSLLCTEDCEIDTCTCEWEFGGGMCGPSVCGNGERESGEECDIYVEDDQGNDVTCANLIEQGHGEVSCTADCRYDLSACTRCGDGVIDSRYEECDGAPIAEDGAPLSCAEYLGGGYAGVTTCSQRCEIETDKCVDLCGNGSLDPEEACDGDAFEVECSDFGFVGGSLGCTNDCQLQTHACHFCGNGVVDDDEPCDGEAFSDVSCSDFVVGGSGQLSCTAECELDASDCEAVGVGLLVISEVMIAPTPMPLLSSGEWIEFHNPDPDSPFPLSGCTIEGMAAFETADLDASISIPPGGYMTLGKGTVDELGFEPDGELAPQSTFTNAGDVIRIRCAGILVDELTYEDEDPWPAQSSGTSIVLHGDALDVDANDSPGNWCLSVTPYDDGRFGTPGAPGGCM